MKNIKYIIAAIFVVAISTGIFFACEKEKENEKIINIKTKKSFDFGNPESYGIVHNEIASYIIQNQPQLLFLPNTIEKFDSICSLSGRYLIEHNYFNEMEVENAINNIRNYYLSFGINSSGELNYYTLCYDTNFIRQQLESFGYSDLLIDQFVVIYQESLDTNASYNTILSHIVNIMGSTDYGIELDNTFRDKLTMIYVYSNQFWDTLDCYALPPSQELIEAQNYITAQRMKEYLEWQERRMLDALSSLPAVPETIMEGINNSYSIRKR